MTRSLEMDNVFYIPAEDIWLDSEYIINTLVCFFNLYKIHLILSKKF